MLKKNKVVMLRTNEKADVFIGKTHKILHYKNNIPDESYKIYQHIYITSDDEIKEGDWYLNQDNKVFKSNGLLNKEAFIHCKKIIATTDSLIIDDWLKVKENKFKGQYELSNYIPKPSDSFISKYIEEYNKGNVISEVLVEYEEKTNSDIQKELGTLGHDEGLTEREYDEYIKTNSEYKLKVNPKDNTITIKKVKDSWSRKEVEIITLKAMHFGLSSTHTDLSNELVTKQWFEENL